MPAQPTQTSTRGWCFTINNYTNNDIEYLNTCLAYQYIIYGKEVGENGTPHLQGYIHFKSAKKFTTTKKLLQRAHIEPRKGSIDQAIEYCKKENDFYEKGTKPISQAEKGEKGKAVWSQVLLHARQGNLQWIEDNYPKIFIWFSNKLQGLRIPKITIQQGELLHEWWTGSTGTGKSKTVWELYPDHFQKELNKWWCGYEHENVVVIEEWSPKNECTGSHLKIWADRYPFTAQIKGSSLKRVRPLKLIVLSNYTIRECFPSSQDFEPLERRFTCIRFPRDIELAKERQIQHTSALSAIEATSPAAIEPAEPTEVPEFLLTSDFDFDDLLNLE